jgi:peptidoglycan/xylan/chitin deacetylase (PgdA/CDA1 family)
MSTRFFFKVAAKLQFERILRLYRGPYQGVTILCFHRISSQYDYFWQPIFPETFKLLLEKLRKEYEVVSITELTTMKVKSKRPLLALSFDDGYKDFIEEALPILQFFEMPSNHNIVINCAEGTDYIWTQKLNYLFNLLKNSGTYNHHINLNAHYHIHIKQPSPNWFAEYSKVFSYLIQLQSSERNDCIKALEQYAGIGIADYPIQMMSWEDISSIAENNVEIGSHTTTHDSLTSITDEQELEQELIYSKSKLEEKLKRPCQIMALPNGLTNDTLNKKILQVGYQTILGLTGGGNNFKTKHHPEVFNRLNMVQEPTNYMTLRMRLFDRRVV